MKAFIGLVIALATTLASAQETVATWQLSIISSRADHTPVGAIYHVNATGTEAKTSITKYASALRFICSYTTKEPSIIAVYWNGNMEPAALQHVDWRFDGKPFPSDIWAQDQHVIWRSMESSAPFIAALSNTHSASVTWIDANSIRRTSVFNVEGFSAGYDHFLTACKK